MRKRLLIVVGSTGGHYFPGLALAESLREKDPSLGIRFAGEQKVSRLDIWRKKGFEFVVLPVLKRPKGSLHACAFPFRCIRTLLNTMRMLDEDPADLVVGMGSYTSLFPGLACRCTGRKMLLHEQNYRPGLANRILSLLGVPVALTFPETRRFLRKYAGVTGMPVRGEFSSGTGNAAKFGLDASRKTILVLGGSQGATFINMLAIRLPEYLDPKEFQIAHLSGSRDFSLVRDAYAKTGFPAMVKDFSFDVPELFAIASYAVARAGAGTVAELTAMRVPSVLIPYPYSGNHQRYNARYLEKRGICVLLSQERATPESLYEAIMELDRTRTEIMKHFTDAGIADTRGALAATCMERLYG